MAYTDAPFYPIIYVRGYAMTREEIDQTTADPFCGFNVGSTVYRAVPDEKRPPRKFVFESPLVRLASDFEYRDVYEDGYDIVDPDWALDKDRRLTTRSVIVFRYYDEASTLLGTAKTPPIETFSKNLGELILRVRDLVCSNPANRMAPEDFRCYLVAHSMGGLVCRGLLQNPHKSVAAARQLVEKFFTYATPHDGIELAGLNVPKFLSLFDTNNFNRSRMAEYLNLQDAFKSTESVAWLPESSFPSERVFCMVGTNRSDYEVGMGLSRTFVGHGSDGLVRIENATLRALDKNGKPGAYCAKAFAYRSHSGPFGIVNSEESYQNLVRFLFGDVRVDIWADIEDVRLPKPLQEKPNVNALYQIELLASTRGKPWYLTRRIAEEDSVACLAHSEWRDLQERSPGKPSPHYLSTIFLANRARVNPKRKSLAYSVTLGIRVPDYEVDKRFWFDEHYEGGYLYRNTLIVELVPPAEEGGDWKVELEWQNGGSGKTSAKVESKKIAKEKLEIRVPFDNKSAPGVAGTLRFVLSAWNHE